MTLDELEILITANSEKFQKEINSLQNKVNNFSKNTNVSTGSMAKGFMKATIVTKALAKAIQVVTSHLGDAVKRLDTLNNYTNVMKNLGIGSKDAQASIDRLSDKLSDLPTTLDDAVQSVQRFTSANGNIKASTEMFLALNNALIAGGTSTSAQAGALEQITQAYSKGKPDMMEWRAMLSTMPAQLNQIAKAMGYVSADALGEALRSGTVSMNEFMTTIVKLNKEGISGFESFEKQALNSAGGVQTSIANMKNAITKGLTAIMDAIGQSNIASFFEHIRQAINNVIPYIVGFVKAMVTAVNTIGSIFGKTIFKSTKKAEDSVDSFGASIVGTTDDMEDATGSAGKLAKALNGLAGFDEMNVLKEQNDSGGGSSGSSGGANLGDLSGIDLSAFDTEMDNVTSKADLIAEKITSVFSKIGGIMKTIWDSAPVQAYVGAVTTYGQFLWDFWSTIGTNLWTNIVTTWQNIEFNVSTAITNMSTLWTQFWIDIQAGIETWGQPIIDGVAGVFNSIWQDAIDPAIQHITTVWADFTGILLNLWNKHGKPLIDNVGEFVTNIIQLFQKIWDDVLEPIITPFLETVSWLWDEHISKMVEKVGDFIGKLVNGALEIYNKFLHPIISMLLDILAPAWAEVCNLVIGVLGTLIGYISDVVGRIFELFGGIIDFLVGVFTGNWQKAWEGVKSIFSSIVNGFVAIIKLPINLIIDAINSFISGLNQIEIPDWVPAVGGMGFNIPKIPKLEKGGVIDNPTIAMIGEAGKEAVVPLENNTGWIDELAERIGDINNDDTPVQVVVKIGEDTILNDIITGIRNKSFETNGEVFAL